MTLEQIRAGLPTHIMLTPGVHRWLDGDEWWSNGWKDFSENDVRYWQYKLIIRRPIPPEVREAMAVAALGANDEPSDITAARIIGKWLREQIEN